MSKVNRVNEELDADREDVQDDAIIGKALMGSLVVLGLVAVVACGIALAVYMRKTRGRRSQNRSCFAANSGRPASHASPNSSSRCDRIGGHQLAAREWYGRREIAARNDGRWSRDFRFRLRQRQRYPVRWRHQLAMGKDSNRKPSIIVLVPKRRFDEVHGCHCGGWP